MVNCSIIRKDLYLRTTTGISFLSLFHFFNQLLNSQIIRLSRQKCQNSCLNVTYVSKNSVLSYDFLCMIFQRPKKRNRCEICASNCVLFFVVCLFVCLFVCLEFLVPLENFSHIWRRHAGEVLQIVTYARHLWPLSSEGSSACHTYCDTGHPFIKIEI